jgi:hypothetical protein
MTTAARQIEIGIPPDDDNQTEAAIRIQREWKDGKQMITADK